ncbi:DUF397 domain-containing protein [Nocardia sp. IFM 10818]
MTTLKWRKASASGHSGDCVEIAETGTHVLIRDSKYRRDPANSLAVEPILSVTPDEWTTFVTAIRSQDIPTGTLLASVDAHGAVTLSLCAPAASPRLVYTPSEWTAFLDGVHRGEFDLATRPSTTVVAAA